MTNGLNAFETVNNFYVTNDIIRVYSSNNAYCSHVRTIQRTNASSLRSGDPARPFFYERRARSTLHTFGRIPSARVPGI